MAEPSEALAFGLERELEYTGHITPAQHLVPLPRRTFASADETHIRIWGQTGDLAKTIFPSNRRSMVSAMAVCPTFSAILTTEVDMTLKAYSTDKLEVIETFSLEQARNEGKGGKGNDKSKGSQKVTALAYLVQYQWVLVGGENGCELFRLSKSTKRRVHSVGRLEYHLQLTDWKQVTTDAVLRVVANAAEQRVIIWGPTVLHIYDMDLKPLTRCDRPHAGPVCSACIHVVSIIDTALLTGGADGNVNFWSIQGKQQFQTSKDSAAEQVEGRLPASMRLEHSFHGHLRAVETVSFYHRLERDQRQRLAVSCARDGKMKVWSLEQFSVVYTLDISMLDARAYVFPLAPHFIAISSSQPSGAAGMLDATVTLVRFTSHVATPFATTNQSPVVLIAQPPVSPDACPDASGPSDAAVLVSEDMAIRVIDASAARLLSTLPPPPNSKVQVLRAFLCPVWQLLVLWLSSQEIAVFFLPAGQPKGGKQRTQSGSIDSGPRKGSTTPLLIRRFSIVEVRTSVLDKDLSRESFHSVALHHGPSLPARDTLVYGGLEEPNKPASTGAAADEGDSDWFLVVGTKLGTLHSFLLADLVADLPIWEKLAANMPSGKSQRKSSGRSDARLQETEGAADQRLQAIENEHLEAMELARVPGQRPFPVGAPPLRLHGRWRCHDYAVEETESVTGRLLTIDSKRNLKIWRAADMSCVFRFQLGEFACHIPYIQPETSVGTLQESTLDKCADVGQSSFVLAGLAIGTAAGTIQILLTDSGNAEQTEVFQSHSSHADAIIQIDFTWPANVFVSVGKDDVVKIWSRGLVLLRDIVFPQPLTAVTFRRRLDMDPSKGHGDVLLGFAAHVEQVSLEFWSRGILKHMMGTDSPMHLHTQKDGDHADSINLEEDHEQDSFSEQRAIPGATSFTAEVTPRDGPLMATAESELSERRYAGRVFDLRGPPLQNIGTLSGVVSNWFEQNDIAAKKQTREPSVEHKRSETLDRGDFRAITRCHPGYYDWKVSPDAVIDAPREHAIRGTVGVGNVALVTSLGIGHLRGLDEEETSWEPPPHSVEMSEEIAAPPQHSPHGLSPQPPPRPEKLGPRRPFKPQQDQSQPHRLPMPARGERHRLDSPSTLAPQPQSSKPPRPNSASKAALGNSIKRETMEPGGLARPSSSAEAKGDESWRNLRVGRGVPQLENVPKPRIQGKANTDEDTAKMLLDRGHLIEAPDAPETNFLKNLFTKKTEWLYCSADSNVLAARRRTIKDTLRARNRCVATWTPAGRLVCGEQLPPSRAVPLSCMADASPSRLRMRAPMTRAEVTEQNLIEAALHGPPQLVPDLAVQSEEEIRRVQEEKALALALAARASGGSSSRSSGSDTSSSRCSPPGGAVTDGPSFAIGRAR